MKFAHHWDRIEGATFAPHVLGDPLPGSSIERVLFQAGLHDVQTPFVSAVLAARTMGLGHFGSAPIAGIPPTEIPSPSAFVVFDTHAEAPPAGPVPPARDNGVHEAIRRDDRAQRQIDAFLRPSGDVIDTCGGLCD